jgi:hypothetical protein
MERRHETILPLLFILVCAFNFRPEPADPEFSLSAGSVCKRLSMTTSRIRLLTTSIMNFGGGEAEFNRLVDKYAQATSYYFNREYDQSAKLFTENEREILNTAMKLGEQYKNDTITLQQKVIAENVRYNIKRSLEGQQPNPIAEKFLRQGTESVRRANDLLVRSRPLMAFRCTATPKKAFSNTTGPWHQFEDDYDKHIAETRTPCSRDG